MASNGGSSLLGGFFLLNFPTIWLFAQQDIVPIIGVGVILIIIVVLVVAAIKWYHYTVKKGLEEYEREQGKT